MTHHHQLQLMTQFIIISITSQKIQIMNTENINTIIL